MKRDKRKKKGKKSNYQNKLVLFQKPDLKFGHNCPLSVKNAPVVDYKNIKLLKKYTSDTGKILSSRITSVCQKKQRQLSSSIKKAKILGLI
tara:strand:+ start:19247 stop:19519 length:273 start_codon:yes stop_codon:yes gene_type:complete